MAIKFNIDEILEMAERIEKNGAAFYRRAAQLHAASDDVEFLKELATMEDDHQATFAAMRRELSAVETEQTAWDPYDEQALYLQAMADGHGGEGDRKCIEMLTGSEPIVNVLLTAIVLEKKSIDFYFSLKGMIPARLGGDKLDKIIDEERGHMVVLAKKVKALHD